MTATWRVLGLECSDGECCECCGASCPKRRVVLTDGEQEVRFGSSCAAYKLLGSRKAGAAKAIAHRAEVAERTRKWLAAGHSPEVVARAIAGRFGYRTQARVDAVEVDGVGLIKI